MKLDSQSQPPIFPVGHCRDAYVIGRPKLSVCSLSPVSSRLLSPSVPEWGVGVSPGGPSQGAYVEKIDLKN